MKSTKTRALLINTIIKSTLSFKEQGGFKYVKIAILLDGNSWKWETIAIVKVLWIKLQR
jgi:hypothetical protein